MHHFGGSGMADFNVGFVIFPGITRARFHAGPFEVLSRLSTPPSLTAPSALPHVKTHVIAKNLEPVASEIRGFEQRRTGGFSSRPRTPARR